MAPGTSIAHHNSEDSSCRRCRHRFRMGDGRTDLRVKTSRRVLFGAAVVAAAALAVAGPAQASFPGKPGVIAFDSSRAIRTITPLGHGLEKLGDGTSPAFSPDGKSIVFVDPGRRRLTVMRSDGSHPRVIFESHSIKSPCFSADGSKVFFSRDTSGEGYADLYSIPVEGGSPRRLTRTGTPDSEIDADEPQA